MRTSTQVQALRQARNHFLEHGRCPSGTIDDRLARSWERSFAAGLVPTGRLTAPDNLGQRQLGHLQARHQDLLAHSRPVMEYLFEQVRPSQSLVVLAGPCGTLMHAHGDAYFLGKAERVALSCGASWLESQRGTNAIGTALAECGPVEVHGAEHYLERNGFLTCAAAPILSGTGHLLGVLDISGEHRSRHPYTLGLVNTAARMIENRLLVSSRQQPLRLHVHAEPEGIGTIAEGIVGLSQDGWVISANQSALRWLNLSVTQLGTVSLEQLVDARLEDLLARHHRRAGALLPMRLRDGRLLFAQLHRDTNTIAAYQSRAEPARTDALAQHDTGDVRWRAAADKARRVLGKPIALLILGESGVGKEWFAQAAHASSPRRDGPFVAINCAAIPEALIESELFGYLPGSFTGARREGRPGLMREADGGTLFLDEIGDMPLTLQTRLLRVLQERQVVPLGGGLPVAVDFALICASNRPLRDEVEAGRFRNDLYYRINGLTVALPPLRERSDLAELTARMLAQLEPERELRLADSLEAALTQYGWPGNLRQLASVLRTACAMLESHESVIDWQHLADDFVEDLDRSARYAPTNHSQHLPQNLDELSRKAVQQALESSRGNISQAARLLGISRQTLYRKLGEARAALQAGRVAGE